jgi:putative transposase
MQLLEFIVPHWYTQQFHSSLDTTSMKPRPVHPGEYYMIQRRCSERRFFLRPSEKTNNTVWYCLGHALAHTGVQLIAATVMSNHVHLVVYDKDGTIPDFLHRFHMLLARALNCALGRWENFWAVEQTSRVRLVQEDDIIAKVAYTLANPVSAQLVDTAAHWPGATSWTAMKYGRPQVATRPLKFFRDNMPARVTVTHVIPQTMARDDFWLRVQDAVAVLESKAAAHRRDTGVRVLGRRHVCKQSQFASPTSQEPRRRLSPRVACRSKWHRIEALQRDKVFVNAYRDARSKWIENGELTMFPAGTWALRRFVPIDDCGVMAAGT